MLHPISEGKDNPTANLTEKKTGKSSNSPICNGKRLPERKRKYRALNATSNIAANSKIRYTGKGSSVIVEGTTANPHRLNKRAKGATTTRLITVGESKQPDRIQERTGRRQKEEGEKKVFPDFNRQEKPGTQKRKKCGIQAKVKPKLNATTPAAASPPPNPTTKNLQEAATTSRPHHG